MIGVSGVLGLLAGILGFGSTILSALQQEKSNEESEARQKNYVDEQINNLRDELGNK